MINPATNTVVDTISAPAYEPGGWRSAPPAPRQATSTSPSGFGNSVSVINPATNTVTATIPVGTEPHGVAVSPTGPYAGDIYVTNYGGGTVSVINPATNTVTATIPVGTNPWRGGGQPHRHLTPATSTSPTMAAPRCR